MTRSRHPRFSWPLAFVALVAAGCFLNPQPDDSDVPAMSSGETGGSTSVLASGGRATGVGGAVGVGSTSASGALGGSGVTGGASSGCQTCNAATAGVAGSGGGSGGSAGTAGTSSPDGIAGSDSGTEAAGTAGGP